MRLNLHNTEQIGADAMIDCLAPGAPADAMLAAIATLRRGGKAVNIGGMKDILPLNINKVMSLNIQIIGSCWFSTDEAQLLAQMAGSEVLNLSVFEHKRIPLAEVNSALALASTDGGGFTNIVVTP